MYADYETPMIRASVFYYDKIYTEETAEAVVDCLTRNSLFPPQRIRATHIKPSKDRYTKAQAEMADFLKTAHTEKDVLVISWKNVDSVRRKEYLDVSWTLTYFKLSEIVGPGTFEAWNVLSFNATYGWINKEHNRLNLFNCIHELVPILHPFNIQIDDLANSVDLVGIVDYGPHLKGTAPPEPGPRHLHTSPIYWGNYWGSDICNLYDVSKLSELPVKNLKELNGGVFFTLTDHVMEFDTSECKMVRSMINREILHK